jgi:hypothetical protein
VAVALTVAEIFEGEVSHFRPPTADHWGLAVTSTGFFKYGRCLLSISRTACQNPGRRLGNFVRSFTEELPIGSQKDNIGVIFRHSSTLGVVRVGPTAQAHAPIVGRLPDRSNEPIRVEIRLKMANLRFFFTFFRYYRSIDFSQAIIDFCSLN